VVAGAGDQGQRPTWNAPPTPASPTPAACRSHLCEPAADWSAAGIAQAWQISTARLRALLFAEGESLRSLVREQRVAWVLAQLARMEDAGADAGAAGFASLSPCSAPART
jgi:hypothetical protein